MLRADIRRRVAPLTPDATVEAHAPPDAGERCVTCSRAAGTPFCPHCGERRARDHAYTLHALAADVWDFVTPADGRTLRTLWTLARHPGELTSAYMRGERRPYLSPLALFFFVNAGYFVYVGVTKQQVFNTPLRMHLESSAHHGIAQRLVAQRLAGRHVTYAEYERKFNGVVDTQAKTLIVAMVPGFSALAALVAFRRGRTALHHLAFGFHGMTAFLLGWMLGMCCIAYPVAYAAMFLNNGVPVRFGEPIAVPLLTAPFIVWLVLALRRAYGDGRVGAVLKAGLLMVGLIGVLFAYRALLFFTAFWAT